MSIVTHVFCDHCGADITDARREQRGLRVMIAWEADQALYFDACSVCWLRVVDMFDAGKTRPEPRLAVKP